MEDNSDIQFEIGVVISIGAVTVPNGPCETAYTVVAGCPLEISEGMNPHL